MRKNSYVFWRYGGLYVRNLVQFYYEEDNVDSD